MCRLAVVAPSREVTFATFAFARAGCVPKFVGVPGSRHIPQPNARSSREISFPHGLLHGHGAHDGCVRQRRREEVVGDNMKNIYARAILAVTALGALVAITGAGVKWG